MREREEEKEEEEETEKEEEEKLRVSIARALTVFGDQGRDLSKQYRFFSDGGQSMYHMKLAHGDYEGKLAEILTRRADLEFVKNKDSDRAVMVPTFKPSTQQAEGGKSLSSRATGLQ